MKAMGKTYVGPKLHTKFLYNTEPESDQYAYCCLMQKQVHVSVPTFVHEQS